jgi:hypothetical protein
MKFCISTRVIVTVLKNNSSNNQNTNNSNSNNNNKITAIKMVIQIISDKNKNNRFKQE